MSRLLNRRELLVSSSAFAAIAGVAPPSIAGGSPNTAVSRPEDSFRYCLNTSTIRGQKLSIVDEIKLASEAGYDGIEPWIREINDYVNAGGSLTDLKKRIADAGLKVESAIGFANWIVDDDQKRADGLEAAKRDMDLVQQIGGTRTAAPPVGYTNQSGLDLFKAAERYAALCEVGATIGVRPELELWGFSKSLSRLGELIFVAVESGHDLACILPDVYHIYKGGSDFAGLRMINGAAIPVFHINDYPDTPSREAIGDGDRVYPGDGVAPLSRILRDLYNSGFRGALSLELFNREYWQQDAAVVAKTGLEKMKAAVTKAFS